MKKLILLLSILTLNTSTYTKKYCDIKGNINNPGVYEIKNNYTIQDIINEAGGLKKDSYTNNINLSKKVTDEMVIYIFNKKEIKKIVDINNCLCQPKYKYITCDENKNSTKKYTTTTTTTKITNKKENETPTKEIEITTTQSITESTTTKLLININNCSKEDLLKIKGLGDVKAEAIITYRNENGIFENKEDIMNVKGIGKTTFEKIKEFITI